MKKNICWGSSHRAVDKASKAYSRAFRYIWHIAPGGRRRFSRRNYLVWKKHIATAKRWSARVSKLMSRSNNERPV